MRRCQMPRQHSSTPRTHGTHEAGDMLRPQRVETLSGPFCTRDTAHAALSDGSAAAALHAHMERMLGATCCRAAPGARAPLLRRVTGASRDVSLTHPCAASSHPSLPLTTHTPPRWAGITVSVRHTRHRRAESRCPLATVWGFKAQARRVLAPESPERNTHSAQTHPRWAVITVSCGARATGERVSGPPLLWRSPSSPRAELPVVSAGCVCGRCFLFYHRFSNFFLFPLWGSTGLSTNPRRKPASNDHFAEFLPRKIRWSAQ